MACHSLHSINPRFTIWTCSEVYNKRVQLLCFSEMGINQNGVRCEPKNHKIQIHSFLTCCLNWSRILKAGFVFAIYRYENIIKEYFCCVEVLTCWVCKASIWQGINQVINLNWNVIEMEPSTEIWAKNPGLSLISVRHGMC